MTGEVPKYELLADHFFEPDMVGKHSVIEYDGIPNHLMRPLNGAAEARLDAWYEERFLLVDEKTGKPVLDHKGEKQHYQPRLDLKPRELRGDVPRAAGVRVLSTPEPAKLAAEASIAAMQHQAPKEWARPEPDAPPANGVKVVDPKAPLAGNTVKGPA